MAEVVAVEIGGIRLRAESVDPGLSLGVDGVMARFSSSPDRPDVTLTVRRAPQTTEVQGRLLFRSGGLWDLWDTGEARLVRLISPALGPVPYKTVRFAPDFRRGQLEVHDGIPNYGPAAGPLNPFEYPLDELICMHWLAGGRGIELHACGIVDEHGVGRVFVGHSGAGKTTLSSLWRGPGTILSDDRIIVRLEDGGVWMYGTPWHGEARLSAQGRAPLRGIYLLAKASHTAIRPVTEAAAVAQLYACSFVPPYDPLAVAGALQLLGALLRQVPCRELQFHRSTEVTAGRLLAAENPAQRDGD
jgi:hypothetical protein